MKIIFPRLLQVGFDFQKVILIHTSKWDGNKLSIRNLEVPLTIRRFCIGSWVVLAGDYPSDIVHRTSAAWAIKRYKYFFFNQTYLILSEHMSEVYWGNTFYMSTLPLHHAASISDVISSSIIIASMTSRTSHHKIEVKIPTRWMKCARKSCST